MKVIGYHIVMSTYGFWLPNDPRGLGSRTVRAESFMPFGPATYLANNRQSVAAKPHDRQSRFAAKQALKNPEVKLTGRQALSIANGFAEQTRKSGFRIHACANLPQHMHLVVSRHHYDIEQVVRLLKQAGTAQLLADGQHPFAYRRESNGRLPSVWGQSMRKVFLFQPGDVFRDIRYVEHNPIKEGKPPQKWSFVVPSVPE